MNEEYEELPCPETNTFKVGDMVRAYDTDYLLDDYIIKEINKDKVRLRVYEGQGCSWVSFKQCRLLKKKETIKPREFFIYRVSHGILEVNTDSKVESAVRTQDRCHACGEDFNK